MNLNLKLSKKVVENVVTWFNSLNHIELLVVLTYLFGLYATLYSYKHDYIIAYGDAESHLNIAKRVVSSLTPGLAQLGGIWLPLPHLLMVPLVAWDPLWHTGLAGSIVSGIAYIITSIFIYKTIVFITKNKFASFIGTLVFALNPNILYMQSTPMTELPLLMFFALSSYYFIRYLYNKDELLSFLLAAFFCFCATLSRYDGWFLALFEALIIILKYFPYKRVWAEMEGKVVLFATLAFFGIVLWFAWGYIILGDPLYFTHSQFSAKSQQQNWLMKGELPGYQNIFVSVAYYFVTAMSNSGVVVFLIALAGLIAFIFEKKGSLRFLIPLLLLVPFIFNVTTLYLGQSVIFIPSLTPTSFEWRLFNVRYGVVMIPVVAIFVGYLFSKVKIGIKTLILGLCALQILLFVVGYSKVITLADGTQGLSSAKRPDAESWMKKNYDKGLVLIDDYARTISIIRSGVPMQDIIYIGNKPYWNQSLLHPEQYARWIVMQTNDSVWKALYSNANQQNYLYKYYQKAYTSKEILIFKRNDTPSLPL